ncbi:MAG: LysE family translocator [Steroidobacteraceae bacterium]
MLNVEWLPAYCLFAFAASVTPGPNNLMLMTSGMNHGVRATLPHLLGVCIGFMVLLLAVGFGLGALLQRIPAAQWLMHWLGTAYLLFLAWKTATSGAPLRSGDDEQGAVGKPMSFTAAVAFQWVNPKAWMMAIGAFSTYLQGSSGILTICLLVGLFAMINAPCVTAWALCGSALRTVLQQALYRRAFNIVMALLLVLSLRY